MKENFCFKNPLSNEVLQDIWEVQRLPTCKRTYIRLCMSAVWQSVSCQSVCTLPFRPCLSLSPLYVLPSPFLSLHLLYVSIPSYSLSLNLLKFLAFLSLSLTQTSSPSLPLFSLSSDLTLRPLPHPLPPTSSLYIFSFHAVSSLRHPPTLPPILPTARSNTIVLR